MYEPNGQSPPHTVFGPVYEILNLGYIDDSGLEFLYEVLKGKCGRIVDMAETTMTNDDRICFIITALVDPLSVDNKLDELTHFIAALQWRATLNQYFKQNPDQPISVT